MRFRFKTNFTDPTKIIINRNDHPNYHGYQRNIELCLKGHIEKHRANIEVLLEKTAGIAEHPDTLETIEKELAIIAEYDDQLEMLNKYFVKKDPFKQ